jgi:hypothetical protein
LDTTGDEVRWRWHTEQQNKYGPLAARDDLGKDNGVLSADLWLALADVALVEQLLVDNLWLHEVVAVRARKEAPAGGDGMSAFCNGGSRVIQKWTVEDSSHNEI